MVRENSWPAAEPPLSTNWLATLMESGRYDRHLLRMREVYRQRREVLARAGTKHAPALRLVGLEAGCHAVLELPAGVTEAEVVQSALRRAVGVNEAVALPGRRPAGG